MNADTRARLVQMHTKYDGFRDENSARVNVAHFEYLMARAMCLPDSKYRRPTLQGSRLKRLLDWGEFARSEITMDNYAKAGVAAFAAAGVFMATLKFDGVPAVTLPVTDRRWRKCTAKLTRDHMNPFVEYCELIELDQSGLLPDPFA